MPPQNPPSSQSEERSFQKLFLVLLFFITVTQFSAFGYQSVTFILGSIFNVQVVSTPLDVIIGLVAMVASALVFAAAAMWWRMMPGALTFFTYGTGLFIGKNILDLFNETMLYSMANRVVSMEQIQELASILGQQFFQLAFWVVVFFYFRYVIKRETN